MKFHKVLSNSLVRRAPDVTVFHTLKFNRQIRHFGPFSKYSKTKFYRFSHQFQVYGPNMCTKETF